MVKDRYAVLLRDGDTWIWKHKDDLANKHASIVDRPAIGEPALQLHLGLLSRPLGHWRPSRCPGC